MRAFFVRVGVLCAWDIKTCTSILDEDMPEAIMGFHQNASLSSLAHLSNHPINNHL